MGLMEILGSGPAVRVMHEGGAVWGRREGGGVVLESGERLAEEDVRFLAPVEPTKILAVHLTYRSRVEEYAARLPPEPSYFLKPPTTLNGHRGLLRRPAGSRFLNYEGELAVVVGRRMKGVEEDEVLEYVAGYTCANDVGLHDFRHADRGSMLRVKGQDGFLPLGPEIVPAGAFDPDDFMLRTYLNGEVVQEGGSDDLLFGVAYQLADLCRLITLEPGDVVLTGTPANSRPMEPGDTVEVEIDGIGRLSNTVEEWDVDLSGPGEQPETSANTIHVALAVPEEEAEKMVKDGPTKTRVNVDMNLCQSNGECMRVAPEIFRLGDDDVLRWKGEVDPSQSDLAHEAVDACPMQAITVED
jgi:5-oxopent-3-ene-1,2,5-tricarboxylate decarboxylase/2-hydroxyhepta-2,4-diene-1,7-dioate isomerase